MPFIFLTHELGRFGQGSVDLQCGNKTHYTVDEETSRNEEVIDRLGNKTAYEYDVAGRTTKVTSKNANGTELAHVSYAYDAFDNMTEIVRGDGLKYELAYNAYHNLESIGIDGKECKLATYTYKNGNGRLKAITYANGDTMKATYNTAGQMVAEKWTNWLNAVTAHYKYVYDGQGNIVRSLDLTAKKEYTYTYQDGKLMRAQEYDVVLSDEIVTGRTLFNTVAYFYDADDRLYKKTVSLTGQTIHYENPEDGNTVVKFTAGGKTVTSHSKNDSFGRKVFDELQLGTGVVSREFRYHAGEETEQHTANGMLKSRPTTQLVSQIALSDGRTISYEYDAEERITKVDDSVDGITEYTYDALGQLLTEKHKAVDAAEYVTVNTMTYDNYGNILTKNGVVYGYNDGTWKDRLMQVNGVWIFHDEQGNPTYYQGHDLSWEKGRQLKTFDSNSYTYNANGIRTSKTVGGIRHDYLLDGTKILQEDWGGNSIVPLYDNEDSVCGILFDAPYYFQKNLQGDIIAITNANGEVVARYRYDAWGVPTITMDVTPINIATVNPFRYRGYYYDTDTGLYYLQSRYYDPVVGRFINADDSNLIGLDGGSLSCNLFVYCYNSLPNYVDQMGTSPLQVILAAVFGVVGFIIGDYIARGCGLSPSGKGAWKYWALRSAVAVGGAALGWFAGGLITKLLVKYLSRNPRIMLKLSSKMGSTFLVNALNFLGINPIGLMDKSLLMGFLQTVFNNPKVTMPSAWVKLLLPIAEKYGWTIRLDSGHIGTAWNFTHLHIGKVHIAILKSIISFIKSFLKG